MELIFSGKSKAHKRNNKFKVAFLILAHKNPSQIVNFVDALDCDQTAFFIHIDKKSNIINHSCLDKLKNKKNVFFTPKRKNVTWGGYGDVEATLQLMKECLEKDKYDYISLHSGQDLPIKNKYEILEFLKKNRDKEFIRCFSLDRKNWYPEGTAYDRISYYWFIEEIGLDKSWELYEAQKKLNIRREYLKDLHHYAGWQWWTLTRECCQYIIDFTEKNPSYCDFYKYTLLSDEGFFQTIVTNSHFKEKMTYDNLMYHYGQIGDLHPWVLTKDYFKILMNTDNLFARKFDINVDNEIIQMILNKIM